MILHQLPKLVPKQSIDIKLSKIQTYNNICKSFDLLQSKYNLYSSCDCFKEVNIAHEHLVLGRNFQNSGSTPSGKKYLNITTFKLKR
jgi:hypothetical protein